MFCISEFFGITIFMYYNDFFPPHFHAEYADHVAIYSIGTIQILSGKLPPRAQALVVEWATLHRHELEANWARVRQGIPLKNIEPLE